MKYVALSCNCLSIGKQLYDVEWIHKVATCLARKNLENIKNFRL
jgi:hypothetical protein